MPISSRGLCAVSMRIGAQSLRLTILVLHMHLGSGFHALSLFWALNLETPVFEVHIWGHKLLQTCMCFCMHVSIHLQSRVSFYVYIYIYIHTSIF